MEIHRTAMECHLPYGITQSLRFGLWLTLDTTKDFAYLLTHRQIDSVCCERVTRTFCWDVTVSCCNRCVMLERLCSNAATTWAWHTRAPHTRIPQQMPTWSGVNIPAWRTTSTSRHCRWLRSASATSLDVRHTRLSTVGDSAFLVAAARHCCLILSPSSADVLNHISSQFLILLSGSSFICTVPVQWLVFLDTIIAFTLDIKHFTIPSSTH